MRFGFGVAAVVALGIAAWAVWLAGDDTTAGIAARVGLMLAAVWVAWPALTGVRRRAWWFAALAIVVLLWRPRAAIVVLPVLALVLRGRRESDPVG